MQAGGLKDAALPKADLRELGVMLGLDWGYIGILEKEMETIGSIGIYISTLSWCRWGTPIL